MQKTKFCIVGAGYAGKEHLRALLGRDDTEVSAADPSMANRERIASEFPEIKTYQFMEDAVLDGGIDAAVITLPPEMHAEAAVKAFDMGLHVFLEKPTAPSLEECMILLRRAKSVGKIFSVGCSYRFDPFVKRIKLLADSGCIGNIVYCSVHRGINITPQTQMSGIQTGGAYSIISDCIRSTDMLYHIIGRMPDHAFSNAIKAGNMSGSMSPHIIDTIYRWRNGDFSASTHFNYVENPESHTVRIIGDGGYIFGDYITGEVTVGSVSGKTERFTVSRTDEEVLSAQWDNFIRSIYGEAIAENTPASVICSSLLLQAQKESVAGGREVDIREIAARYGVSY